MNQAIISLKPRYAELVLSGNKTVELRNRRVRLKPGTRIWLYATQPMACIVGIAEVESVVHANPAEIWRRFGEDIGIDRNGFDSYIGDRERVSALVLRSVEKLGHFMTLDRIRESVRAFQPPQFYARLPEGSRLRGTLDSIRQVGEGRGATEWRPGGAVGGRDTGTGTMKRPQRRSRPRRRTRLSAVGAVGRDELARMETMAVYRPSPYHKSRSSAAGLQPAPAPRPDKTICDRPTPGSPRNAADLLRSGFRRGMVSERRRGDWPQNVWAVDEEGMVYEGQLGNLEMGEYHGYPMKQDDGFAGFIRAEWKRRGT